MIDRIKLALEGRRFNHSNEAELQAGIAVVLREAGIHFLREFQLKQDRIDFFVVPPEEQQRLALRAMLPFRGPPKPRGIGIEVKVAGAVTAVTRQLLRYAYYPEVRELILLTTRAQHAQIPRELGGKRLHVHYLGFAL